MEIKILPRADILFSAILGQILSRIPGNPRSGEKGVACKRPCLVLEKRGEERQALRGGTHMYPCIRRIRECAKA